LAIEDISMQAQAMTLAAPTRQQFYERLLAGSDSSANAIWLAQIIASWQAGEGVLPDKLGLSDLQFDQLRQRFLSLDADTNSANSLDFSRMLEKQDLEQLLRKYAATSNEETEWLITIIVAACLGSDHLWHDLGLWSRKDLSAMLKHNFPEMAARNSKDMKWKKFLYKQLCEAEGLYLCRAPSCEVCQDYPACFGPED
jgi:nitrogen fixation protein NifQ